jgi:hypothetical protein
MVKLPLLQTYPPPPLTVGLVPLTLPPFMVKDLPLPRTYTPPPLFASFPLTLPPFMVKVLPETCTPPPA